MLLRARLLPVVLLFIGGLFGLPSWAVPTTGDGFTSTVEHISATEFPTIRVWARVFTPQPIAPTCDNFTLHERGEPISEFRVEMQKKTPYTVLLIDRSSSMEPVVGQVKQAAATLVKTLVGKTNLAVVTFSHDVDIATEFGRDAALLQTAVQKFRPYGGTALYDALFQSCELLADKTTTDDVKTVICLTDGKDESPAGQANFSVKKPKDVAELARRQGIRIITVGLGTGIDEKFLAAIAKHTGGWYLHAVSIGQLPQAFANLSARMMKEQRYHFTYRTPKPDRDGSKREVVIVSDAKGRKDQGKGSYTAPTTPPPVAASAGSGSGAGSTATTTRTGPATLDGKGHANVDLGRLIAPDLGKPGHVGHLTAPTLGTSTPINHIATEGIPEAGQQGIADANATIDEANRLMKQLDAQNQAAANAGTDQANQTIDGANQSSDQAAVDAQQQADQATQQANKALEDAQRELEEAQKNRDDNADD